MGELFSCNFLLFYVDLRYSPHVYLLENRDHGLIMHYLGESIASGERDNVFLRLLKFQVQYSIAKEMYRNTPLQGQLKVLDATFLVKNLMHNQYSSKYNICHCCQSLTNEWWNTLTSQFVGKLWVLW